MSAVLRPGFNITTFACFESINNFSKLLDSKFRIPFTNIRFGVDFVVGLVPYAGDLLSFLFSGGLVVTMAKHGVSGKVLALMLWNIFLDKIFFV